MTNSLQSRNNPMGLLDPFFDEFFDMESNSRFNSVMKTDIKDNGDHYEFKVEMPDIKKEDIKVSLSDGYLTIEAKHTENNDEQNKDGKFVRRERYYGSYKRSFYVGDEINQEDVKAKLDNGVLTLTCAKKEEVVPEDNYITIE